MAKKDSKKMAVQKNQTDEQIAVVEETVIKPQEKKKIAIKGKVRVTYPPIH